MHPGKAYDLWAETYDDERDDSRNPVAVYADLLLAELLERTSLAGRRVLDVGCGTGAQWPLLRDRQPASLVGCDISAEMLARLAEKHSEAETHLVEGTSLGMIGTSSTDLVLSSLVIGHFADPVANFRAWDRVLRPGGEVILIGFVGLDDEPGSNICFCREGRVVSIEHYRHSSRDLQAHFDELGWRVRHWTRRHLGEDVRHFFRGCEAQERFERLKGRPIVFGVLLQKGN